MMFVDVPEFEIGTAPQVVRRHGNQHAWVPETTGTGQAPAGSAAAKLNG